MNLQPARITVVIVLFKRAPAESEAFTSLQTILATRPAWNNRFRLILYDNSPEPATESSPHSWSSDPANAVHYVHDRANSGLSTAYNYALSQAIAHGSEWLLLLDQDTVLSGEYVSELLAAFETMGTRSNVGAIVPILECEGIVYSPASSFFFHLSHQFPRSRHFPVTRDTQGIQPRELNAYNSGAALRVTALQQIGRFPSAFPLDYLDAALFHLLQQNKFSIFVLRVCLEQKLSHTDLSSVPFARHESVMQSQSLFVVRYGNVLDRILLRMYLLRLSRHYRRICSDPRVWKRMVRQALGPWKLPVNKDQL